MKTLCKEYTFNDIKEARKIKTYKYARMFYNYGLIKGYPVLGKMAMLIAMPIVQAYISVKK